MSFEDRVRELSGDILPADEEAMAEARERHLSLTKPPGSMGLVEGIGVRLAGVSGEVRPPVPESPAVVVCAGDHGVLEKGVSPWPKEVTAAMVGNFLSGGAAVNAVAKTVGARVAVLDVGVAAELPDHPSLRSAKVRCGTDDISVRPAMEREEAARAVMAGAHLAEELAESGGVDLLITGDMGIGNTTPAACLAAAFTGRKASETTGRGTGINDEALEAKTRIVEKALALHEPDENDPLGVLASLGGLEHSAICGVILGGAACGIPVLLDGVVSNSAALAARAFAPESVGYMFAGHLSTEPGSKAALESLGLEPILDLGMRLGEGTGALLAVPILQAAARVLSEMATFEEAGVEGA